MDAESAPYTAFSFGYGHYQFRRMSFGLKCAPSSFQRLMNSVLSGLQGQDLLVYMDDITIHAKSLKDHSIKLMKLLGGTKNWSPHTSD